MMNQLPAGPPAFATFGAALKFLRKRARLTQDELGRAVGYGREQIARLENGSRLPDLTVLAALFVPALHLEREPLVVAQFMELAATARHEGDHGSDPVKITVTHETHQRIAVSETILEPDTTLTLTGMHVHQLPNPLLPIIGRADAIDTACALLQGEARLVTLVGAPGIGKTRLALEVGRRLADEFTHGAAWVALAPVQRREDLVTAVATALELTLTADQPPATTVRNYLSTHALLLVLDNCEHLLDAVPEFLSWLHAGPQLKLLCTSRTPLDLYSEYELAVPPLLLPNLAHLPALTALAQTPAVKLFAERTRAVAPEFSLNEENALAVAGLCVALDGLPLAIELAAARMRTSTPQEILQQIVSPRRLHQPSSTLLTQSKRGVDERHRTLHAAIDWSVRLCSPQEQRVLARLGVFAGGFTLDAVRAVCEGSGIEVQALLRANLIYTDQPCDNSIALERFAMFETLRAFASEQLSAQADLVATQARHATWFAGFAQEVFAGLLGEEQAVWMQRARSEIDNFRAALRFALSAEMGETAIALASGLWWFWNRQGLLREGSAWLEASLNCPVTTSPPGELYRRQRARALNGAGSLATEQGNLAEGMRYHEEGLALRQALGDVAGAADILHNMALTARCQGDFSQALQWFEASLAITVSLGDPPESDVMNNANIGITHFEMGALTAAQPWLETAYSAAQCQSDRWRTAYIASQLAALLLAQGDLNRARQIAQESAAEFEALGDQFYLAESWLVQANVAYRCGALQQAHEWSQAALDYYRSIGDRHAIANALQLQSWLALAEPGQARDAARKLFEEAWSLRHSSGQRALSPFEQAEYARLRTVLDDHEVGDG
ncbi:MAG: tetratricopeptide repeat protein [Anaerolineales bacterium]|nr:tetratricopeptide repeat protein [Anaerolineales bacterium]